MFQKGPGKGYHTAKKDALAINPRLSCKLSYDGGLRHFRIFEGETDLACGATSAREAWNKILGRLEAKKQG